MSQPSRDLKIALLPLDIVPMDPTANLAATLRTLDELDNDTDLAVVPEMFTSGYAPDHAKLKAVAEPNSGPTISRLQEWAKENNKAVWGTFVAIEPDGSLYNRGFMIDDKGSAIFYDKHHLFSLGGENKILTAGRELSPIVSYRSWNLRMAICYDLRFPVALRSQANNYDALIVPANWPASRSFPWHQLMVARAIENQVYVAGCNRRGDDHYGTYEPTQTIVLNHWGKEISDRRDNGIVYAILQADKFNSDRAHFAPWRDADNFKITIS